MQLPASFEADEYSRWVDDDGVADSVEPSPDADVPTRLTAGPEAAGGRLDKWLAQRLPDHSRSRLQRWIADGHVRIDGRIAQVRDPVHDGDEVVVAPQPGAADTAFVAEDVALDIVFEDAALIVVDKRAGLVVHPAAGNWSGTVLNGLLHRDPSLASVPRAGIVHRLDKDTSGLMVVARTIAAQTDLVRQLQARTVGRTYLAIVHGTPPPFGRIDRPIGRDPRERTRMAAFDVKPGRDTPPGAKPAATRFETLATATAGRGTASLVVCRLETGRTHQIRVHLQSIGHPLVGDATYGGARGPVAFGRQALHAWRLALLHPTSHAETAWRADPPTDFAELAARLGFDLPATLADLDAR